MPLTPPTPAAGLGAIGDLIGGIVGNKFTNWDNSSLINVLNTLNQYGGNGWLSALQNLNPASAAAQGLLNRAPQLLFGGNGTNGTANDWQSTIQQTLAGMNPQQFQQFAGGPMADNLSQLVQNGGYSPQGGQIYNMFQGLGQGQNPSQQQLLNMSMNLTNNPSTPMTQQAAQSGIQALQNGGMTPDLNNAASIANYIMSQGGSNSNMNSGMQEALQLLGGSSPYISQLAQAGGGGLSSNLGVSGLTPTGAMGEQTALQGLQVGGSTPLTNQLQGAGANMATTPSVLPMLLAMNTARDQATTNMAQAAQAARAQAMARGGGAGDVVSNGMANQGLADFANQGAQGISGAVENAMLQQQGLGLQQQNLGTNMGLGAGQLQASRLGNFGSLLNNLENTATGRYSVGGGLLGNAQQLGTAQSGLGLSGVQGLSGLQSNNVLSALGMLPGIQNAATQNASALGGLGLSGGNLNLQTMGLGQSGLNSYLQSLLSGGQGMQNELGQANQYTLGAGNLYQGLGQLGLGQTSNYYNNLMNLMGQQGNFTNSFLNGGYGTGLQALGQYGNTFMSPVNTALGGMSGLFSHLNPANQNQLGQGISAAGTALGGG